MRSALTASEAGQVAQAGDILAGAGGDGRSTGPSTFSVGIDAADACLADAITLANDAKLASVSPALEAERIPLYLRSSQLEQATPPQVR